MSHYIATGKDEKLLEIAREIVAGGVCSELREQATQLVFGAGNPDAEVVFIGEAPGKKEDETGKPFVGASGRFLDDMLASIDLKREDIYITNIVKYRPPDNRDPFPDEKQAFWPYLVRQLDVIRPKLIVTLGRHSMEHFLPNKKISQIHGKTQITEVISDISGQKKMKFMILPLYHPAAALYNGSQRKILLEDFSQIPNLIREQ